MSELSEGEKKEYEAFKYYYQTNTEKGISYIPDYMCENVLNLIEKQQKEIERLEARKYMFNAETGEISQIPLNNNYISKDKIKAKIEDYNKMIKATYEDFTHYADYRRDVCLEIKNVLNELLEE